MRAWASFGVPVSVCRDRNGRLRASLLAAGLLAPSAAQAECKDNFRYYFKAEEVPGFVLAHAAPMQNVVPLGVGSSLNALMTTMNTVNTAFLSPSSSFISAPGGAEKNQFGGGVWGRSVTGEVESKATTSAKIDLVSTILYFEENGALHAGNSSPLLDKIGILDPAHKVGTSACTGTVHEAYYGYQFGYDLAVLNLGGEGANVHFGVTAGYFGSKTKDTTPESSYTKVIQIPGEPDSTVDLTSPAGTLGATTQVPFIGLYAALTSGNFFADGLVRQDFYLMRLTDPANGLTGEGHNAYGLSAAANVGYKIQLPFNWFIEPSGGALWSWVKVDPLHSPGALIGRTTLPLTDDKLTVRNDGTVRISDIESLLGRATLRIGTTISLGDVLWQPFFSGTVFHEFAGNVKATTEGSGVVMNTNCANWDPLSANPQSCLGVLGINDMSTSTSRIGTFYQYSVGTALVLGNSGWLGYGRFDYRTGENVEGYAVTGGLRYHW